MPGMTTPNRSTAGTILLRMKSATPGKNGNSELIAAIRNASARFDNDPRNVLFWRSIAPDAPRMLSIPAIIMSAALAPSIP